MDTSNGDEKGFSPPYNVPWATFINTVDRVAGDLPNKIDRTYLSSQSGSVQTYLISAFRSFGFITDDGYVTPTLKDVAASTTDRPAKVADLLRQCYPEAVALGQTNATPGELADLFGQTFPRIAGASRVKAIRFFLAAAEYAQLPVSPLWKTRKAASGSGQRKARPRRQVTPPVTPPNGRTPSGDQTMKDAYFSLLIKKAEERQELDTDLLDRIERLIGVDKE